jgi:hypothetical protein
MGYISGPAPATLQKANSHQERRINLLRINAVSESMVFSIRFCRFIEFSM